MNAVLKKELEKFGQYGELSGGANELATNVSQALIRWLPHNYEAVAWLKKAMKIRFLVKLYEQI